MDDLSIEVLNPEEFVRAFVAKGERKDGRKLNELRPLSITTNPFVSDCAGAINGNLITVGSSMVHLGATRVCCAVTLQVGTPPALSPDRGDIDFEVTLGTICSQQYDQRGKPDDAYELESLIETVIKNGNVVDLTQLCIEREKLAFQLNVHIVCLSHAGNLHDAAVLAAVAALGNTRLPDVVTESVSSSGGNVASNDGVRGIGSSGVASLKLSRDSSRRLVLQHVPVPITVGIFDSSLLTDLTSEEQQAMHGYVRCAVLEDDTICYLAQFNGSNQTGAGTSSQELHKALAVCRDAARLIRSRLAAMTASCS